VKRLVIVLLMVLMATFAFADFRIGAVGMYNGDFTDLKSTQFSDFTFGAEAKLELGIFQVAGDLLLYPQPDDTIAALLLTDAGLSFKLAMFRFGLGLGPNLTLNFAESVSEPVMVGLNLKPSFDVDIGNLSIGVVAVYYFADFKDLANIVDKFSTWPWLGLTATVKIF